MRQIAVKNCLLIDGSGSGILFYPNQQSRKATFVDGVAEQSFRFRQTQMRPSPGYFSHLGIGNAPKDITLGVLSRPILKKSGYLAGAFRVGQGDKFGANGVHGSFRRVESKVGLNFL